MANKTIQERLQDYFDNTTGDQIIKDLEDSGAVLVNIDQPEWLDEYSFPKETTQGLCGIMRMAFTTGLFVGLTGDGYNHRYCYHTFKEAKEALEQWNGNDLPPGNWIVRKGYDEFYNPNHIKDGEL